MIKTLQGSAVTQMVLGGLTIINPPVVSFIFIWSICASYCNLMRLSFSGPSCIWHNPIQDALPSMTKVKIYASGGWEFWTVLVQMLCNDAVNCAIKIAQQNEFIFNVVLIGSYVNAPTHWT